MSSVTPMTTYVALLRAVNVGGANRIKMADLKAAFVTNGFVDATTHIQTGNVIFTSKLAESKVKSAVEALITEHLALSITAIVRSAKEMTAVIAGGHPLGGSEELKQLYVSFLDQAPKQDLAESFGARSFPDAEFEVVGREIFIRYHAGAGTSKLTNGVIESKLKVKSTARNWNVTTNLTRLLNP